MNSESVCCIACTTLITVTIRMPDPSVGSPTESPVSAMWNETGSQRSAHAAHTGSKRSSA